MTIMDLSLPLKVLLSSMWYWVAVTLPSRADLSNRWPIGHNWPFGYLCLALSDSSGGDHSNGPIDLTLHNSASFIYGSSGKLTDQPSSRDNSKPFDEGKTNHWDCDINIQRSTLSLFPPFSPWLLFQKKNALNPTMDATRAQFGSQTLWHVWKGSDSKIHRSCYTLHQALLRLCPDQSFTQLSSLNEGL